MSQEPHLELLGWQVQEDRSLGSRSPQEALGGSCRLHYLPGLLEYTGARMRQGWVYLALGKVF